MPDFFGPKPILLPSLQSLLLRTGLIALYNLPSLNPIIAAFSRHGFPSLALQTFSLLHRSALPVDSYSLCTSLTAAAAAAAANPSKPGTQFHALASKSGQTSNIFVAGALINFYVKTNYLFDARKVFDEIPIKNTVCLNALLNGYIDSRLWTEAMSLFRGMNRLGLEPDDVTLTSILRVSAEAGVIGIGTQVHACLVRGVGMDTVVSSALVEMYGKCGLLGKARVVFELARREGDVVLWTSMLNAYGRNGRSGEVVRLFEEMLVEKIEPDEVAFLAVLSACRESGKVAKGVEFLDMMERRYGFVPGPEHYGCVVDMICRAGGLKKAWKFVSEGATEKGCGGRRFGVSMWGAILSACRDCGDVKIGEVAARRALELDPGNAGIYVELSNLYARVGMWDEIGELREAMKERGLKKDVGFSWLERVG